jgi:Flp pilus assembly protein TadB
VSLLRTVGTLLYAASAVIVLYLAIWAAQRQRQARIARRGVRAALLERITVMVAHGGQQRPGDLVPPATGGRHAANGRGPLS